MLQLLYKIVGGKGMLEFIIFFVILIPILFIVAIPFGIIKNSIHRFFDYVSLSKMWLRYAVYYTIMFTLIAIYIYIKYSGFTEIEHFPIGEISILYLIVFVGEVLYFYRKYYSYESTISYAIFMFVTTLLHFMLFYIWPAFFALFMFVFSVFGILVL